jgi:hypothetical protein
MGSPIPANFFRNSLCKLYSNFFSYESLWNKNLNFERIWKCCILDNLQIFKIGKSFLLNFFSNEPEDYNTAKTDVSEGKFSVLSILQEKFEFGRHLEFFQLYSLTKLNKKVNLQKNKPQKANF